MCIFLLFSSQINAVSTFLFGVIRKHSLSNSITGLKKTDYVRWRPC